MPKLTNDEAAVLLALERLATHGLEWQGDDPDDGYGMGSHFPGSVSFWLLAMYVAGVGDVTTSNRITSALRALCMLGFVNEEIVDGPPEWLHHLPRPPKSRPLRCLDGRTIRFALEPPGRLLITRPDRPDWRWPVYYNSRDTDVRYLIAKEGGLAARSLVSGSADASGFNDDVVVSGGGVDPTRPDAKGYVARPGDPSSYVPMATIRNEYCNDISLTTIKAITKVLEDFPTNGVRWTRPASGKTGAQNSQRRSVHLVDWESFVNRLKGRSLESTESGFPDVPPSEIDAAKAKIRRDRPAGK